MDEPTRPRVAIGVFYKPTEFNAALALLTRSASFDGVVTTLCRDSTARKMLNRKPIVEADGLATYLPQRNDLTDTPERSIRFTGNFGDWIEPSSAAQLNNHIGNDACVMFVFTSCAAEEAAVYRVLMKLACDKVEIHDLPIDFAE